MDELHVHIQQNAFIDESSHPNVVVSCAVTGCQRKTIEMTPQAKGHPLFPMLDFIACGIHSQNQRLSAMEVKISKLDSECQAVRRVQEELYQLM